MTRERNSNTLPKMDDLASVDAGEIGNEVRPLHGQGAPPPQADLKWPDELAKAYGKALLLPGESETAYARVFEELAFLPTGEMQAFDFHLCKEMTDGIMLARRWRGATVALIDRVRKHPESVPSGIEAKAGSDQSPTSSPEPLIATVPVTVAEATAILAHYGFDRDATLALSLLASQELRNEFAERAEAAERSYHRALDTAEYLREARAQLATAGAYVGFVKARTFPSIYAPCEKPSLPIDKNREAESLRLGVALAPELVVEDKGFTELGRSILGPPPLVEGESEADYGNLYLAIRDYFGLGQGIEHFLISDAVAATWEKRRLREASEALVNIFFRRRAMQSLKTVTPLAKDQCPSRGALISALGQAGIAPGEVSAATLRELTTILRTLDDELVRLEDRRRRSLKKLVELRAKSMKLNYLAARELEFIRKHQWKCT